MNQAIGGYFQLELRSASNPLYQDLIHLNSGRNCFEYILRANKYKAVYIPYFTCDVLVEPLTKLGIEYYFYEIDDNLEPVFNYDRIKQNQAFLSTNYFGLKTDFIKNLTSSNVKGLIVDDAQAFFSPPITGVDTFYSPRKFFGVPDGGLLSTANQLADKFEDDYSYDRFSHLIKRIDLSPEDGFMDFKENDRSLSNLLIKRMSALTQAILSSIDYKGIAVRRRENFQYVHSHLKDKNLLDIELNEEDVPMVYPFRVGNAEQLRKRLISKRIYCATYWPNVFNWCSRNSLEYSLANEIISLPIDQRYSLKEMELIVNLILHG